METKILFLLLFVVASLFLAKLIGRYVYLFFEFMFNQESKWYDKSIEKPRLLFHIFTLILFLLSFLPFQSSKIIDFTDWNDYTKISATFLLFGTGVFTSLFSWSSRFKYKFIPNIESKIQKLNTLKLKVDLDKDAILKKYLSETYISKDSFDDFERFIRGEEIENHIAWVCKTQISKQTSYPPLFDLLHEIVEGGFLHKEKKRSLYERYVIDHFIIKGVEFEKNIKPRYCEWITKMNKAE